MNVKVGCVTVVITRLLEINAIRLHVSRKLRDENLETEVAPAFRVIKLRQQQSDIKKAERLAGKVCVRTEVSGEIRFEVRRIQVQKLQHAHHHGFS